MPLLENRPYFKPFEYQWAYEAWLMQQKMHWMPEEVPLADDILDWKSNLSKAECNLLTQIFRFFTQADVEVSNCYLRHYTQVFKPPEISMMLASFANMETIHIEAYSVLLDTVGMPETEYQAFLEYSEMKDKYDFMQSFHCRDNYNIAMTLAVFGGFTEGLQLFASFAMLLNFQRFGKMKGMCQIVAWSLRDETLHTNSIIRLFRAFITENPGINTRKLHNDLTQTCKQVVEHEDRFIDLAFKLGNIEGLTSCETKEYIKYIADRRMLQLGLDKIYYIKANPLPWMDTILNGLEHANFFEAKSTEYTKFSTAGKWEDVF